MTRRAFGAWVVGAALLVAGCSSGGGKWSTPTTVSPAGVTTVTRNHALLGRIVPDRHVVANFAGCPAASLAAEQLSVSGLKGNAGIKGLGTRLVPIKVSNVRICAYYFPIGQTRDVVLNGAAVARFTADTNRIRTPQNGDSCPGGLTYFITFANNTQRVSLAAYCDEHLTNGAFAADATLLWVNELRHYTSPATPTGDPSVIGVPIGPTGPGAEQTKPIG
jgi:hypothetical protein